MIITTMTNNYLKATSMFRMVGVFALVVIIAVSCTSNEGHEPSRELLEKYRTERNALDDKIRQLEEQLGVNAANGQIPVGVYTVSPGLFKKQVTVKAIVDSRSSIAVAPKTSGQLVSLRVVNGQSVAKGQVLAELDDALIQRGIEEVTTQLEFATTLYEKQLRIFEQKAGSEVQYLQAKNNKESLEKRLASLREQLDMTKIKAPTSGIVDGLRPKAGEMVMAGMQMMTIVNTSDMRVIADLAETYAGTIRVGDVVTVRFPDTGDTITSRVGIVSKTVNPVNRSFRIEIPLRSGSTGLKPNATCDITLTEKVFNEALTIPLASVVRDADRTYVYKVVGGKATKARVVIGAVSGETAMITDGVGADDVIVHNGVTLVSDGQRVRVVE